MGPLTGLKLIEIASIGPGPFCGMMLSDMGAEIIRIDRIGGIPGRENRTDDVLGRGRRSVAVNLKEKKGQEIVLKLCQQADGLFEGMRPGVAERIGIGPESCMANNARLVYGRMTGWGQDGPLAKSAGHDLNYIALSGALHGIGKEGEPPTVPLNLVGDFGGGGLMLAFGMVCALFEAKNTGEGQVVDASMVDGSAALMANFFTLKNINDYTPQRGNHFVDGGSHFYNVYETKDKRYVSIGSLEKQFYEILKETLSLSEEEFGEQMNRAAWPSQKEKLKTIFLTKTQAQWDQIFEGTDVCYAPVLSIWDAPQHPHNEARKTFIEVDGVQQPAPAPRYSRTQPAKPAGPQRVGQDTSSALLDWGFSEVEVEDYLQSGVIAS
ncbi:MAG: carnitine dehydratase [Gammaproteobacteria bacterium]|nr:MAG: carnitine dehydratase [Gammaproteobacteria bacterium]